jgi:hypothetical protein
MLAQIRERAAVTLLTIGAPLAAKARLSRSSTLGTHTRSTQAHLPAAQSSPPRPLWYCTADRQSRLSKGLAHDTQPLAIGFEAAPSTTTRQLATGSPWKKKEPSRYASRQRPCGPLCYTNTSPTVRPQASVAERPIALPPAIWSASCQ